MTGLMLDAGGTEMNEVLSWPSCFSVPRGEYKNKRTSVLHGKCNYRGVCWIVIL